MELGDRYVLSTVEVTQPTSATPRARESTARTGPPAPGIATLRHPGADGQPVRYDLGGVAIVDPVTMRPLHEVPFQEHTDGDGVATRNAIDVRVVDGRLRLHRVADDDDSDLLVHEAR